MQQRREQLLQELRTAEQALALLRRQERLLEQENLREGNPPELRRYVTQLEQLAQSLPEGHRVRLVIESAIRPELIGSVSRARSALEGEVWTLRGALHYRSS